MLALLLRFVCMGSTNLILSFHFYYYKLALGKPISFNFWFFFSQLVVEKMLASEGMKRSDLTRDEFTARVWEWKDKYVYFSPLPLLF